MGKIKLCLNLELEHKENGTFIHQLALTRKVLKRFNMDNSHPLSTPMVVQLLKPRKDSFRPKESDEGILDPKVPYLNAIGL